MQVNLIVIRTNHPKDLANFYEQLGLAFDYHKHGNGSWHYSAKIGNIVFEIYPLLKNQKEPDDSLRLGFIVDDLDVLVKKLQSINIEIVSEPRQTDFGFVIVVKDLDGRKIELNENK